MKILKRLWVLAFTVGSLAVAAHAAAIEAPDALIKRISQEVMDQAKADNEIQTGNPMRVRALVEAKILPHVDFQRMTALAMGSNWRGATPTQQKLLTDEFRTLLVTTYSGAISQIKDQEIVFKPMRGVPTDAEVEVRSEVVQAHGEPIQLSYRLEKLASGWKIYDLNILGAWLVETYKGSFAAEISKGGIDGLIKAVADKNKNFRAGPAKGSKPA